MTTITDIPTLEAFLEEWRSTLLEEYYEGATFAPLNGTAPDVTADSIEAVDLYYYSDDEASWAEQWVAAVVRLKDGNWATVMASCDSSGWGCQQSVAWHVTATRDDAIKYGLDKYYRAQMGVPLPGEDDAEAAGAR